MDDEFLGPETPPRNTVKNHQPTVTTEPIEVPDTPDNNSEIVFDATADNPHCNISVGDESQ